MQRRCRAKHIAQIGIFSDPKAIGFYEKMGCIYMGEYLSNIKNSTTLHLIYKLLDYQYDTLFFKGCLGGNIESVGYLVLSMIFLLSNKLAGRDAFTIPGQQGKAFTGKNIWIMSYKNLNNK